MFENRLNACGVFDRPDKGKRAVLRPTDVETAYAKCAVPCWKAERHRCRLRAIYQAVSKKAMGHSVTKSNHTGASRSSRSS